MNLLQTCRYALIGVALAMLAFLLRPQPAEACACCAVGGEWFERTETLQPFEVDSLSQLKFAPVASLFSGAAGASPEVNKGIDVDALSDDPYTLSQSTNRKNWSLRLTSSNGKSGNLSFMLPTEGIYFGADLYDKRVPDERLYKELRLQGKVVGDGIFESGMTDNTQFKLILRGRGGHCLGNFQYWNLIISGAKADYSFHGDFEHGSSK